MVLGGHQDLPLVDRRMFEIRAGVADEVPENVLLELGLPVGRPRTAQLVEAGEQRPAGIPVAPVHPAVSEPPSVGIRLGGRDLVDEVPQAAYQNFGYGHGRKMLVTYVLAHLPDRRQTCHLRSPVAAPAPAGSRSGHPRRVVHHGGPGSKAPARMGSFVPRAGGGRLDGSGSAGAVGAPPSAAGPGNLGVYPANPGGRSLRVSRGPGPGPEL